MIKHILIVKETRQGEQRVALIPADVKTLVSQGHHVLIENNAGLPIGYPNQDYRAAGAHIIDTEAHCQNMLPNNLLILRVKRGSQKREQWELAHFSEHTYMMGFLDPLDHDNAHVNAWQNAGIVTFSLDQLKLATDDPHNVLSAMSNIAGRLAFKDALSHFHLNIKPSVIIIGTGTAACAAAEQALDAQFTVTMIGRRKQDKKLESLRLQYIAMSDIQDSTAQAKFIQSYLTSPCIVITAARSTGQKSPILIHEETIATMCAGSVIIDLAGEGGNVAISKPDQTVTTPNGITIINVSAYPQKNPRLASDLYSRRLVKLVSTFLSKHLDINDPFLNQCYVTAYGHINPDIFATADTGT